MPSSTGGILICVVCGLLDATCFLALGGTFAGLMTGNLILMGVSLGGANTAVQAAVFLYPLIGYSIGAILAGIYFQFQDATQASHRGLWLGVWVLAVATGIVMLSPLNAGSISAWLVVTISALYMGFQSAVLYLGKNVTITTNVMTSTLTSFLADYPLQVGQRAVKWQKLWALLGFLFGVAIAAWLLTLDHRLPFLLALFLAALAVFLLTRSEYKSTVQGGG